MPFLIDRFPGPLERLAEEQLPNASDQLHGAVLHRGKLYVTGLLAIHELDPQTGRVLRMSDVRRADCGSANLAIVGEHLFASCVPAGQKPGPHGQKPEQVHEINLATGALVRRYGPAEGLKPSQNHRLAADGTVLWVATDQGLARIETTRHQVLFLGRELGLPGRSFAVADVLVDAQHVWVAVEPLPPDLGGLVLHDKRTGRFRPLPAKHLVSGKGGLSLHNGPYRQQWQLVPGGLEIGVGDRIKRFSYATGVWRDVVTGSEAFISDHIEKRFSTQRHRVRWNGNSQKVLVLPGSRTEYLHFGRMHFNLSPVVMGRRYVLTDQTLEVVDRRLGMPQVVVAFDGPIFTFDNTDFTRLLVDPTGKVALVLIGSRRVDNGVTAYRQDHELLLVDLAGRKILETESLKPEAFSLDDVDELTALVKTAQGFALRTKQGKILQRFTVPARLR